MNRFTHFLFQNNTVPIALGVLFLGGGAAFAASPDARDAVYSVQEQVVSIDNARILNVDVATLPLSVIVTGVTEDDDFYYVAYTLSTVELIEGVWRDINKELVLKVAKDALEGKDLGVYATKELAQVRDAERVRLLGTQEFERKNGLSQKSVATVYGGLVGKLLDPTLETFAGYEPVVAPPPLPRVIESTASNNSDETVSLSSSISGDLPPTISILGNNPAHIAVGATYADLGVLVVDDTMENIGYATLVNGIKVSTVSLDTSTSTTYTITYRAIDVSGNASEANRIVIVGTGAPLMVVGSEPEPVVQSGETASTSSTKVASSTNTIGTATIVPVEESGPESSDQEKNSQPVVSTTTATSTATSTPPGEEASSISP